MKKIVSILLAVAIVAAASPAAYANSRTSRGSKSSSSGSSSATYRIIDGQYITNNVSYKGVINASVIVDEIKNAARKAKDGTVTVRSIGAISVSVRTLESMQSAGQKAGKSVILQADTMSDGNNRLVQGRLYVDPSLLLDRTSNLRLQVHTEKAYTADALKQLQKKYRNDMAVIRCGHNGSFGATLRIYAKLDLSHLDTGNLYFYSYNRTTETVSQIKNPDYSINEAGYLRFSSNKGGDIIVTDSPLAAK